MSGLVGQLKNMAGLDFGARVFDTADLIMRPLAHEPHISLVDTRSLLFTNIIIKIVFQKNAVGGASAA